MVYGIYSQMVQLSNLVLLPGKLIYFKLDTCNGKKMSCLVFSLLYLDKMCLSLFSIFFPHGSVHTKSMVALQKRTTMLINDLWEAKQGLVSFRGCKRWVALAGEE